MDGEQTNAAQRDAGTIALQALVWTIGEPSRAERLLSLTGLDPPALRARIDDPVLHAALLRFLEAHEPDLLACAAAIGVAPADLVATRRELER